MLNSAKPTRPARRWGRCPATTAIDKGVLDACSDQRDHNAHIRISPSVGGTREKVVCRGKGSAGRVLYETKRALWPWLKGLAGWQWTRVQLVSNEHKSDRHTALLIVAQPPSHFRPFPSFHSISFGWTRDVWGHRYFTN
jgi:hypothetical protein